MAGTGALPTTLIDIGEVGEQVLTVDLVFDGWGYVHLFAADPTAGTVTELDTFAIPEALEPDFATGFGDLSVYEVATHPIDPNRMHLAYYAAGFVRWTSSARIRRTQAPASL